MTLILPVVLFASIIQQSEKHYRYFFANTPLCGQLKNSIYPAGDAVLMVRGPDAIESVLYCCCVHAVSGLGNRKQPLRASPFPAQSTPHSVTTQSQSVCLADPFATGTGAILHNGKPRSLIPDEASRASSTVSAAVSAQVRHTVDLLHQPHYNFPPDWFLHLY